MVVHGQCLQVGMKQQEKVVQIEGCPLEELLRVEVQSADGALVPRRCCKGQSRRRERRCRPCLDWID